MMRATTLFGNHVLRVQRLARLRIANRIAFITAFLLLCEYTVLVIIAPRIGALPFEMTPYVYGGLAVGTFGVAAVYALATRTRLLGLLIDIDARLKLRDRLSTAYEYQMQEKSSEFLDLLVDDAGRRLSHLHRRQLFPFKFSRIHALIIMVMLLNAALIGLDVMVPEQEAAVPLDPQVSEQIQKTIEEYLMKNETPAQEPDKKKKARQQLQQQLEQMAQQLEQQKLTREQAIETLQENLNEIQSQQDQLTEELATDLKSLDDIRELPMPSMQQLQELSSQQLGKMKKMLSEALGGELPQDIQANMDMLAQYDDMQETLEGMEDQLANSGEQTQSSEESQQQQAAGKNSGAEEKMDDGQKPGSSDAPSDDVASDENRMANLGSDGQRMPGMDGDNAENQPDSPRPGQARGDGALNPPAPLDRSEEGPQQDRLAPSKKAEYNAHIRSVTTIGEAGVPQEDVGRAYERELEQVLQKEDMPLNYREYIKTYFLSIGLANEN